MRAISQWNGVRGACQAGYTLIELAMIMIIIGVLIAPLGAAYNSYMKKVTFEKTDDNMSMVTTALGAYRGLHGRYPCPASLTATRDDASYGHESDCTDSTTIPIGSCQGGICVKQSARMLASAPTTPIRVRVGAVPFRQLNLGEDFAYDAYGNRLTYVVTESLADDATFKVENGGVGIVDSQTPPQSLLTVPDSAHFALLAHGQNGAGAYTRSGVVNQSCPSTGVMESMNCSSTSNLAVYRQAPISTSEGASYYDDTLTYFVRGEITSWLVNETTPANIYFKDMSSAAGVGIGVDEVTEKNQVNAIARARENLQVSSLCNMGGAACTQANVITGNEVEGGGLKCPAGQYMVAISNNAPECVSEIYENCPAGTVVTGVNANGKIICGVPPVPPPPPTPPADCPTKTVKLCNENQTLLTGPDGTIRTITAGASRTQKYRCDDGIWRTSGGATGVCTCTPATDNRTLGCGTGFSGGIYQERTYSCPEGVWSTWATTPTGNTCVCTGTTETRTVSCPPEWTGTHTQQRDFTCSSDTAGAWGPWTTTQNTCVCNDKSEQRTLNCTGGLDGTYTEQRNYSCASPSWSGWSTTVNNCVCTPKTQNRNVSCQPGYSGQIKQSRDFLCPDATWAAWQTVSNTCSCSDKTEERTVNCSGGLTGTYTEQRSYTCSNNSWTAWATTVNNCVCTPKTENRKVACPTGYEGEITESRQFQCPGGTWTAWAESARNCTLIPPVVCNWEPTGSGVDQTVKRGARVGDQCTCGASGACHEVVGARLYYNYNSCSCK